MGVIAPGSAEFFRRTCLGGRGVPNFFVHQILFFFVPKNSVQNFKTLGNVCGTERKEKKERKIISKIVDTTPAAMPKGGTLTSLGSKLISTARFAGTSLTLNG